MHTTRSVCSASGRGACAARLPSWALQPAAPASTTLCTLSVSAASSCRSHSEPPPPPPPLAVLAAMSGYASTRMQLARTQHVSLASAACFTRRSVERNALESTSATSTSMASCMACCKRAPPNTTHRVFSGAQLGWDVEQAMTFRRVKGRTRASWWRLSRPSASARRRKPCALVTNQCAEGA